MSFHSLRRGFARFLQTKRKPVRKSTPRLSVEILEERALPSVYTVANTLDSGAGSLRQAILDSNASVGIADTIEFDIPVTDPGYVTATDTFAIKPLTALPTITDAVTIDGYTQAGSMVNSQADGDNRVLKIELDGSLAGISHGLHISAGNSTVRGLAINSFGQDGIRLDTRGSNFIAGNFIGTDVTGQIARANGTRAITQGHQEYFAFLPAFGVEIIGGSSLNVIGTNGDGTEDAAERNVISANLKADIFISGAGSNQNVVAGNFIGTNADGDTTFGQVVLGPFNLNTGIFMLDDASFNRIGTNGDGTADDAERNIISGHWGNTIYQSQHGSKGIDIAGVNTTGNVVAGNYIGTDVTGMIALGNKGAGIFVNASTGHRIGTNADGVADAAERNIISGNAIGVQGGGAVSNTVAGNYIGTDVTGTQPLANDDGILMSTSSNNIIGGLSPAARNIVSGNRGAGINFAGSNNVNHGNNVIQGNYVGTEVTGTVALPNNGGIGVTGRGNLIGGTAPGARNIISGNLGGGVSMGGFDSFLYGNYIGVDVTGTQPLGDAHPSPNLFFPQYFNGVTITGLGNQIGGVLPGEANIIANNSGAGVMVMNSAPNTSGNSVRGNSIYGNGSLGIDLARFVSGGRGINGNDAGDADIGANDRQNHPLIASAASGPGGTTVTGTLNSTPLSTFTLDFYANPVPDPSGRGEGHTYLGSATVATDVNGDVTFNVTVAGVAPVGHRVSATATNAAGSTSEFSANTTLVPFVPATISGQKYHDLDGDGVKDPAEPGLSGWTIFIDSNSDDLFNAGEASQLTGVNGDYTFTGLQTGTYRLREVPQAGWMQTSANPADITVDASGLSFTGIDFGNRLEDSPRATISGMKFNDEDADGVRDPGESGLAYWPIFLDSNGSGVHDLGEPLTYTNLLGGYSFTNLDPGTYRVREVQEPGWVQTTANPADIVVSGAGQTFSGVDFGNDRDPTVTLITGTKFNDADGDGVRDPGEGSLGYWPIFLDTNSNDAYDLGEPLTFTNIGGNYAFSGLSEGTYRIRELQRPGWTQTTTNPADVVVTTIGQTIGGVDFGNNRDDNTLITGRKYFDTNTDGIFDPGEPGLAWWPIFIDTNSSGSYEAGEPLTYTDWNGGYSFVGLPPGTYRVREAQFAGWTQTSVNPDDIVITADGQTFEGVDFGNHRPDPTIISGQKFEDLNDNGTKDSGEPGIHYWPIYIDANANDAYDAGEQYTLTNWQGNYAFVGTATGTYRIREVPQSGWRQTTTNPADVVVTSTGQIFADRDFGNFRLARIVGAKFSDDNANGLLDPGETGLGGWTIFLDANGNDALDSGETQTTTGIFGGYSFDNLEAGTYRVREVQQPGWTKTSIDQNVTVAPNVSSQVHSVNIGNFRNGSIDGGIKFHDINRNGVQDPGEPGLYGWTIFLDGNGNDALDSGERSTMTDLNGGYSFGNLPPGTYHIREVQQSGWVQTTGPIDVTISSSGQSLAGGSIGNFALARISGAKFEDDNANGILDPGEHGLEGWTIYLDANQNGALDVGESQTTTNLFGAYSFDSFEAGAYYVREVQQFGWTQTTPASVEVTVVPNVSAQVYTVNVGNFRNGSMEGIKFHDINRNGIQDAGEPGLEGWTIFLDANSDNTLNGGETHTVTNGNGIYTFSNLGPGTYHVREVQQPGWVQTTPDIDLDVTTSGQLLDGGKIGNFRLARIHGVKFEDTNANGVLDLGEHGLEDWNIYLDANNNGTLDSGETQTFTNAIGAYSFDNLEADTYYVREVQQNGWTATSPNPVAVTVVPNLSAQSYIANFGNFRNGSIDNGIKFHDINRNGVQDQNEPGLQGWTIFLDTDGDNALDLGEMSTVTDVNGHYSFSNLGPGTYYVREVQQQNWVQTTPNFDLAVTTSGQSLPGGKIGNYRLAQVNGVKFFDDDSDGQRDADEIGLPGWTIFLDSNGNGSLDSGEASRVTDGSGAFSFDGLDAGVYRVREVQQPGWVQTTANLDVEVAANLSGQSFQADVGNVDETPGKITGGGSIDERIRNFGFIVQPKVRNGVTTFTGSLEYQDKALGINLHSSSIDYIGIRPDRIRGRFTGTATINGVAGYNFRVTLEDNGEPGARIDKFRIQIQGPGGFTYDSNDYASMGGLLDRGGNIQIHKPAGSAQSAGGAAQNAQAFFAPSTAGSGMDLYVYGTSADDSIVVSAGPSAGSIAVSVNGVTVGTYSGVRQVHAFGGEGNDVVRVNPSAGAIQSRLFGGAGNDQLYGGTGNNVLVGGDGDDLLVGNAGRDVMIGGFGKDRLLADKESDLLIGGDYLFADDVVALETLMSAWNATQSYQTRVSGLQYGYGAVGAFRLDASTVLDDLEADSLLGALQTDWFLAGVGDTTDAQGNEIAS